MKLSNVRQPLLAALLVATAAPGAEPNSTTPVESWRIAQRDGAWQLLRGAHPVYLEGAVAPNRFELLRSCGANAVRVGATRANLDAAQQAGLLVMGNLGVRGERNGMDWNDAGQVAEQKARILKVVQELKDHPALMFWSVGNELDHIPGNKPYNPALWRHLNDFARAIKEIDTRHPVLTVVGTGKFEAKVQEIAAHCPDMDLLGINAYGDLAKAAALARQYWPRPYVVSEWGPTGHWEVPKTRWKAPLEQTSSEKARAIDERYRNVILADPQHCLGSFVFYWSEKQETTHTWYGLFCEGLKTESIDVMQRHWTGSWPANRAPQLEFQAIEGFANPRAIVLQPSQKLRARVVAADPDGDSLSYNWDIRPEVEIPPDSYAGGLEKPAKPIAGLVATPGSAATEFTAPSDPGAYRLFVTIKDGQGHIAYGNLPFYVQKPE